MEYAKLCFNNADKAVGFCYNHYMLYFDKRGHEVCMKVDFKRSNITSTSVIDQDDIDNFHVCQSIYKELKSIKINSEDIAKFVKDVNTLLDMYISRCESDILLKDLNEIKELFNINAEKEARLNKLRLSYDKQVLFRDIMDICLTANNLNKIRTILFPCASRYRDVKFDDIPDIDNDNLRIVYADDNRAVFKNYNTNKYKTYYLNGDNMFNHQYTNTFSFYTFGKDYITYGTSIQMVVDEPFNICGHDVKQVNLNSFSYNITYISNTDRYLMSFDETTDKVTTLCKDMKFKSILTTISSRFERGICICITDDDRLYCYNIFNKHGKIIDDKISSDVKWFIPKINGKFDYFASETAIYCNGVKVMDIDCDYMFYHNRVLFLCKKSYGIKPLYIWI